ncbi:MAG: tRNA epoxyqueuosine(34) reductase QueG [Rhodobacteraceae bacterium]|nr:tRNA epoxyqueuosine(34) reductase QueG [Paracoccaceae bacterium]
MQGQSLHKEIGERARAEGFDAWGVCRPDSIQDAKVGLLAFLERNYHGEMSWLRERSHWRGDPAALWPAARSVIMLAVSYGQDVHSIANTKQCERGTISVYAQNQDYHKIVKAQLKRFGQWLMSRDRDIEIKVFVDTAPVMEKPLAQSAGLGWQGKHTNLVSRQLGSWFFLGAVFTTMDVSTTPPEQDFCGSCRRCLDVCPTDAFPAPYQLDARRCISYLTIEHKGSVEPDLRPLLGNRIYGCDDCLEVCPWNKFARTARETRFHARNDLRSPQLAELVALDETGFRELFRNNPIRRIGRNRFLRNVLYAIGNSCDPKMLHHVRSHISDPDPVVSDAARWAAMRLSEDRGTDGRFQGSQRP